ncbi:hypothetical protein ACTXT7_002180 [Hymenolepis weldensis]
MRGRRAAPEYLPSTLVNEEIRLLIPDHFHHRSSSSSSFYNSGSGRFARTKLVTDFSNMGIANVSTPALIKI